MSWLEVLILSVVEGFTEFLPVSSTGHMIVASHLINISQTDFLKSFMIIVQLGAILAVLSKYWTVLWNRKDYWPKIAAAFVPTVVLGLLLYGIEKKYLLGNLPITIAALLLGGVALICIENWLKTRKTTTTMDSMSFKQAVVVGICQVLAIVPGVSRSASTILSGMSMGMTRSAAVEFSFLLALPVMASATALDILDMGLSYSQVEWTQIILGMFVAFIVARLSVDWLVKFVEKHSLSLFGWYRIGLAVLLIVLSAATS